MTTEDIIDDLESQVAELNQHLDAVMDYVRVDRRLRSRHEQMRDFYRKVGDLALEASS